MDINDIITLTKAGWSKEEIIKLAAASKAEPKKEEPAAPKAAPEAPKEAPKEAPAAGKEEQLDIGDLISEKISAAFEPFEALAKKMATIAGMPSMDDVQPKGIDDIISDFFKED